MNRRTFIGSLAALFLIPQNRPAFISGSFGRLGKWFGDFKTDMPALLHGTEAVVTPLQARSFMEDRIFLDGPEMKRWLNEGQ